MLISEICKMDSSIKVDRISFLPKNIIDSILTRLTILEAMRTSILSRSWRYQWHSLSKISIKYNDSLPVSEAAHVKIIDHVLSVHCGSVDKFELSNWLVTDKSINRWILYLSRNGIKELIIYKDSKDCKIVELLGSMPILERLEFHDFALQHLAVGDVPARLPLVCSIKHLNVCVNFEDLQELLAAFCIFRSSPFIQHLELRVFGDKDTSRISANGFWEGEHDFGFRFVHLQKVWVTSFTGIETELKFIEFLLANAPALKTMEIKFSVDKDGEDLDLFSIFTKLVRFRRISPDAELILPTY